jgi:hypothetical protein
VPPECMRWLRLIRNGSSTIPSSRVGLVSVPLRAAYGHCVGSQYTLTGIRDRPNCSACAPVEASWLMANQCCPACARKTTKVLRGLSSVAGVTYYRCEACGHVWVIFKDGDVHHVTPLPDVHQAS